MNSTARVIRILFAAVAVLVLPAVAAAQEAIADPVHHWQVTLPPGWTRMDPALVREIDQETGASLPGRNFKYVDGFVYDRKDGGDPPYILIQKTEVPMKRASWADIEKTFKASTVRREVKKEVDKLAPGTVSDFTLGETSLDRDAHRVYVPMTMKDGDGNDLRGMMVVHLASHGFVQVNFYAPAEKYEQDVKLLDAFLGSFRIDPAYKFVPGSSSGGFSGGMIGAFAGIIGALAVAASRKKAAAKKAA